MLHRDHSRLTATHQPRDIGVPSPTIKPFVFNKATRENGTFMSRYYNLQ